MLFRSKTATDPDNPQEVATMDEGKKQLLSGIFWEMNEISSHTESKTETVITESDDGHGNIVQTETTVTRTYLYITVSHKTADEMADLSSKLSSCASKRLRAELLLTSLLGNMYSSTEMLNIVIS